MTVHSLVEILEDSAALVALANKTGVSVADIKRVMAELAEMKAQQLVRMCATARADRIRQVNRETKRGKR